MQRDDAAKNHFFELLGMVAAAAVRAKKLAWGRGDCSVWHFYI